MKPIRVWVGSRWKLAMKDGEEEKKREREGEKKKKNRNEASDLGLEGRLLSLGHRAGFYSHDSGAWRCFKWVREN